MSIAYSDFDDNVNFLEIFRQLSLRLGDVTGVPRDARPFDRLAILENRLDVFTLVLCAAAEQ